MKRQKKIDSEVVAYVYGFLESYTKPSVDSPYARVNLAFDCIDARAFDDGLVTDSQSENFLSIVRVMTTLRRLRDLFDIDEPLEEGQWFHIGLSVSANKPRAWSLLATADYGGDIIDHNVVALSRLTKDQAQGSQSAYSRLIDWCKPISKTQNSTIRQISSDVHIRVLDVGQASFSAIHVERSHDSKIVGYYDAGGPMFFHHRTFPPHFNETARVPSDGFVVLSHWDFDHFSLALTRMKTLQQLHWFAPDQPIGANAKRLQALLPRLTLLGVPHFSIAPNISMWKGSGIPSDRNNSGYVLTISHSLGTTLLTGDVEYAAIPANAKIDLIALGIAHHGASGAGSPPAPKGNPGQAAVSYGLPNRYKHPSATAIASHISLNWNVTPTFISATNRGDVWLP